MVSSMSSISLRTVLSTASTGAHLRLRRGSGAVIMGSFAIGIAGLAVACTLRTRYAAPAPPSTAARYDSTGRRALRAADRVPSSR